MKKILLFAILILSALNVSATGDTNITIDTKGIELCLAADSLDNYICNNSQTLTISGTTDHNLYFIPPMVIKSNTSLTDSMVYLALEPYYILIALTSFIGAVIGTIGFIFLLLRICGVI